MFSVSVSRRVLRFCVVNGRWPHALTVVLCLSAASCARLAGVHPEAGRVAEPAAELTWAEVLELSEARDYFRLRDRLEASPGSDLPPVRFARALVEHAFNEAGASNATIEGLLAEGTLPDSLAAELRELRLANHLRLFEYAAGLAAADAFLADPAGADSAAVEDVRNLRLIFAALAEVPPQTLDLRGPIELRLEEGWLPVQVNDSSRSYAFDTGANLSTIMRSEAQALGLRVLPAGIDVGTSTDQRVVADLAVADRLALGDAFYRNVVFLVLDDAMLTFPGFRIPGIIGFPVIERLGEVQLGVEGVLRVPSEAPARTQRNLAFTALTPLTPVVWNGARLLCQLDTGANRTVVYEHFYRRHRERIDAIGTATVRQAGGAGGVRELPAIVLPPITLSVGDTVAALDSLDVLTGSIQPNESDDYLDCNIGHDILDAFDSYIVNFRDMAFLLR